MTSSEIKSLSLGTITKRDASLWEIAFQLAIRNEALAATEPSKRFDRGEPGDLERHREISGAFEETSKLVMPGDEEWEELLQRTVDSASIAFRDKSYTDGPRMIRLMGQHKADRLRRSQPSKPSPEAQTQPPDFVGNLISAELHYTNPAVPPGLVRVTLDVTDAEYQKLLDSQKLAATEASKTEPTREPGDIKEGFEPPVDEWNSIHTYRRGNPENRFCCKCGAGELHPIHGIPAHLSQGWQPPNTSTEEPKTKENKKP